MDDHAIEDAGTTALLRRLRPTIAADTEDAPRGWRDDLRLFAFTWAAGFLFFLLVIA